MLDAGFALALAYQSLLSAIVYGGKSVAMYAVMAPDDALAPYIILGDWKQQADNTKDRFGQTGTITIDVVTRSVGNARSKKPAADICDAITTAIMPYPAAQVFNLAGFNVVTTVIGETLDVPTATDTDTMVRKLITVTHTLQQA